MNTLYLDIETIPTQHPGVLERIRSEADRELVDRETRIRTEFKKPETIEAKVTELRAGAAARLDEAIRATALDGGTGEIIAIGFAMTGAPAEVVIRAPHESERDLIQQFFSRLPAPTQVSPLIVGHNIEFDTRFIWQRCVVLGLCLPVPLTPEQRARSFCTMQAWAGRWNRDRWPSLHELCLALDIPSPKAAGVDGGQVFDLVTRGELATVRDYCARDVEAVRQIHERLDAVWGSDVGHLASKGSPMNSSSTLEAASCVTPAPPGSTRGGTRRSRRRSKPRAGALDP